jgi:hypothetical protein
LEKAVNEIGVRCLPYPPKNSTIGEVITWFDKEIKALPSAIAKANKIFLVYYLIEVLKMLLGHAQCHHVDGLDAIISSCDASITAPIVKRWWTSHGVPYVTDNFRVEPEVRLFFIVCCSFHGL